MKPLLNNESMVSGLGIAKGAVERIEEEIDERGAGCGDVSDVTRPDCMVVRRIVGESTFK